MPSFIIFLFVSFFNCPACYAAQQDIQLYSHTTYPNYFADLPEQDMRILLDKTVISILKRLEVPHVVDGKIALHTMVQSSDGPKRRVGFFEKIDQIVEELDPGSTVYIIGGTVRTLFAHIYNILYLAHVGSENGDRASITRKTLEELILDEVLLSHLDILGVGSDLDFAILFSYNCQNKKQVIDTVTNFINAAQNLAPKEVTDYDKGFLFAKGDVCEYDREFGPKRAYDTGGSQLELIGIALGSKECPPPTLRLRSHLKCSQDSKFYPRIQSPPHLSPPSDPLSLFLRGQYHYTKSDGTHVKAIRGIRPIFELPCLHLTAEGDAQLQSELDLLRDKPTDNATLKQAYRIQRNARFGGELSKAHPHYKFYEQAGKLFFLTQTSERSPLLRSMLPFYLPHPKHFPSNLLMATEHFREQHCDDNQWLYQGMRTFADALSIMRSQNFMMSITKGRSLYGPGAYSTADMELCVKDYTTSDMKLTYESKQIGIVVPLQLKRENLRIVDWSVVRDTPFICEIKKEFPDDEENLKNVFKVLAERYGIQIIVNHYPILLNASPVVFPTGYQHLVQLQMERLEYTFRSRIKSTEKFPAHFILYLNYLIHLCTSLSVTLEPDRIVCLAAKCLEQEKVRDSTAFFIANCPFIWFKQSIIAEKNLKVRELIKDYFQNLIGFSHIGENLLEKLIETFKSEPDIAEVTKIVSTNITLLEAFAKDLFPIQIPIQDSLSRMREGDLRDIVHLYAVQMIQKQCPDYALDIGLKFIKDSNKKKKELAFAIVKGLIQNEQKIQDLIQFVNSLETEEGVELRIELVEKGHLLEESFEALSKFYELKCLMKALLKRCLIEDHNLKRFFARLDLLAKTTELNEQMWIAVRDAGYDLLTEGAMDSTVALDSILWIKRVRDQGSQYSLESTEDLLELFFGKFPIKDLLELFFKKFPIDIGESITVFKERLNFLETIYCSEGRLELNETEALEDLACEAVKDLDSQNDKFFWILNEAIKALKNSDLQGDKLIKSSIFILLCAYSEIGTKILEIKDLSSDDIKLLNALKKQGAERITGCDDQELSGMQTPLGSEVFEVIEN